MEKILFINACVRQDSRTLELARELLSHLSGDVEEVNLEQERIQPLNRESLAYRQEILAAERFDDPMLRYGRQFQQADTIVIAAPFYDYSFPSALKVYFEAIANVGLTFYYDEQDKAQTLCRAKRFYYVATAGTEFVSTFSYEYVKAMFADFYHIFESRCIWADGLDLRGSDAMKSMEDAKEEIRALFAV